MSRTCYLKKSFYSEPLIINSAYCINQNLYIVVCTKCEISQMSLVTCSISPEQVTYDGVYKLPKRQALLFKRIDNQFIVLIVRKHTSRTFCAPCGIWTNNLSKQQTLPTVFEPITYSCSKWYMNHDVDSLHCKFLHACNKWYKVA